MKAKQSPRVWLHDHRRSIRAIVYGVIAVGVALNLLTSAGAIDSFSATVSVVAVTILVVVTEVVLFTSRPRQTAFFSGSQLQLLKRSDIPSLASMIASADQIQILGGTLKTFTDDSDALDALRRFCETNPSRLRILMMHPESEGLKSTARARQARGKSDTAESLGSETLHSLNRLRDALGDSIIRDISVYCEHPTYSLQRFGRFMMVTIYTLGRGASSPALFVERTDGNRDFFDALLRGFNEVWGAATSVPCERLPRDSAGRFIQEGS